MREQKWPAVKGFMGICQSYLVMVLPEGQQTDTLQWKHHPDPGSEPMCPDSLQDPPGLLQ